MHESSCQFCRGTGEIVSYDQEWGTVVSNCGRCGGNVFPIHKKSNYKYMDYAVGLVLRQHELKRPLTEEETKEVMKDCLEMETRRIRRRERNENIQN